MAVTKTEHRIVWAIIITHILLAYDFHAHRKWDEYENLKTHYRGSNQGIIGGKEYLYYYPPMNLYVLYKWHEFIFRNNLPR